MMMRSVLQLRPALEAIKESTHKSTDTRLQELIPEVEEVVFIKSLIPPLSRFESVFEPLSEEKYPTVCMIIMKLFFLKTSLVNEVKKPFASRLQVV